MVSYHVHRIITSLADKDQVRNLATAPLPLAEELKVFQEIETVLRIKKNFGGYVFSQEKKFPVQGFIVIFSQTIRAAKRNPVEMLRYE
jgi:hypothetical protein